MRVGDGTSPNPCITMVLRPMAKDLPVTRQAGDGSGTPASDTHTSDACAWNAPTPSRDCGHDGNVGGGGGGEEEEDAETEQKEEDWPVRQQRWWWRW